MLYTSEICCCNLNLWPMYANLTSKQNHLDWMVSTKVCRWRRRWELMWSLVGRKVWSSSSKRKVGTTTNSHLFSSLWRTAQCLHSWWKWSNCRPRNFSWWPLCYCISRHWIVDHCIVYQWSYSSWLRAGLSNTWNAFLGRSNKEWNVEDKV